MGVASGDIVGVRTGPTQGRFSLSGRAGLPPAPPNDLSVHEPRVALGYRSPLDYEEANTEPICPPERARISKRAQSRHEPPAACAGGMGLTGGRRRGKMLRWPPERLGCARRPGGSSVPSKTSVVLVLACAAA